MFNLFVKVVRWCTPDFVLRFLKDTLSSKARVWLTILVGLSLFMVWGGFSQGYAVVLSHGEDWSKEFKVKGFEPEYSWWTVLEIIWDGLPVLGKFALCFGGGFSIAVAVRGSVEEEVRTPAKSSMDSLVNMLGQSGITKIYPSQPGTQINEQLYASDVRLAVSMSPYLRLLTIAGFEYLGKGGDSLLSNTIKAHPEKDIEMVLLCPDGGGEVIDQRVNMLKSRDDSYDADKLRQHIRNTESLLRN